MNNNDYIQHFGILGMKWGIRKYQNPDGTLTNEGKTRYAKKNMFKRVKSDSINKDKNEKRTAEKIYYDPKSLTMKELNDRINRYEKEKRYKELSEERHHPKIYRLKQLMCKYGDNIFNAIVIGTIIAKGKKYLFNG